MRTLNDEARGPAREPASTGLRLLAVLCGLLGALAALAVPFLPVHHQATTLQWPTEQGTRAVSAPLAAYSPIGLDLRVPCSTARGLDARSPEPAVLLSTNPPEAEYGDLTGLRLEVQDERLRLIVRGRQLGTAQLPDGDCAITVHSDGNGTTADIGDQPIAHAPGDMRPQLTVIYSDVDGQADDVRGLSFSAEVDNRYDTQPTRLKLGFIAFALLGCGGSLLALRRIDAATAHRPRRRPRKWWRPGLPDLVVTAALLAWWLIGAMTADDGYFLTMARVRDDLGYVNDFYRWFSGTVAPMGWFVELQARWVAISTATPWIRLPALGMGLLSWLLISRFVLPRLGQRVRRSRAAGWAAAAVFLACWLPYDNGLRPEPVVVVLALLTLCAVENAVATRRLAPAALGLIAAALSVAVNPHGMVAALPFIASAKPLVHLLRRRADRFGWAAVLAPVAAAGLVILTVAFSDQTWGSVRDATAVRADIGPSQTWYEELSRYALLFSQSPDGSLTRRFPVLLMLLCLATCAVVLLRRGRIRGAALGPSRRLLVVAGLYFVALALTPTKHTHHFGVLAAVGGSVAALTALATSSTVLRSRRNRSVFFAGLMVVLAFSFTGTNAWWYVSGWGVPWFDKPPSIDGYAVSTGLLLVAAGSVVVAFVEHMRLDEHRPEITTEEDRSRALRLGTAPLSIVCALLMIAELASLAKVVPERWDSYNMAQDNIRQLAGASCGLSDYVYVESDPTAGMLAVSAQQPSAAKPGGVTSVDPEEPPETYLRTANTGFRRDGLPATAEEDGRADWTPPHRFGSDRAPVWGSHGSPTSTGNLRTPWYDVPERASRGEVPVVVSAAGLLGAPNSLHVEFGRDTPHGFEILDRVEVTKDPARQWRDHRVHVDRRAREATKMRVTARDRALGKDGWLALSAPRAPHLTRMTDVVGASPTFVEWTAALVHPCLDITSIHHGIADLPRYRVAGGDEVRGVGQGWSSPDSGGPFGYLNVATSMVELPTYLRNDVTRDWGSLYAVHPYEPDALPASAAMRLRTETHWGWWSPGPTPKPLQLPGDVPNSNDRADVQLTPDEQ
ncbi:arabinosyltransferase domain-containing protein [Saccharopolyspora erythraea]|uniref:arabinosyltransferase domain-containing protein n=1 Tax=Saccharopolyspora erythraea TaxID=1836 RepID=UPI001BAE1805|nr:arabinosyltransferase domain-containing protein [Saccharopolyspora erythraea]QUH01895.1 arabinosyltransferase domain-containing protein [Saccharopolyspora erythraea]